MKRKARPSKCVDISARSDITESLHNQGAICISQCRSLPVTKSPCQDYSWQWKPRPPDWLVGHRRMRANNWPFDCFPLLHMLPMRIPLIPGNIHCGAFLSTVCARTDSRRNGALRSSALPRHWKFWKLSLRTHNRIICRRASNIVN